MCVSVILGSGGLDNRAPTYNCGILGRRKWRPKEEMGGNGEQERERERVLKSVAFVCQIF